MVLPYWKRCTDKYWALYSFQPAKKFLLAPLKQFTFAARQFSAASIIQQGFNPDHFQKFYW